MDRRRPGPNFNPLQGGFYSFPVCEADYDVQ